MSGDFNFWFFSWISFPKAPEYTIRAISNFFENSRRYSQLKVHHRCRWHRWQWKKSSIIKVWAILFGHLWEEKVAYRYIFAFKFTLRSQQPDILPIISRQCHWHRWQFAAGVEFSKKSETVLMGYSWDGWKLIHEKNQKQKISWQCAFN